MKELIEAENDEAQSRLKLELATNKLLALGLTPDEIEGIEKESRERKARLTLRSPVDGTVVQRAAVPGNYYDAKDDLVLIQPTSSPDSGSLGRRR
jgi:cobalt-zinc-cadmium efflux system membrane fusion protein